MGAPFLNKVIILSILGGVNLFFIAYRYWNDRNHKEAFAILIVSVFSFIGLQYIAFFAITLLLYIVKIVMVIIAVIIIVGVILSQLLYITTV